MFLFNFSNIQDTVIINILVYLFANSNICVSPDKLIYLFTKGCVFLLLYIPGNFDIMPNIMNFVLLGAGYFCTVINVLQDSFSPGIQLSYLKTICSLQVLLYLRFILLEGALFSLGLIIPHHQSKTLLCTPPIVFYIWRFSSLADGNRNYSWWHYNL